MPMPGMTPENRTRIEQLWREEGATIASVMGGCGYGKTTCNILRPDDEGERRPTKPVNGTSLFPIRE